MKKKKVQKLPAGWTLQDVHEIAAYYDGQTDAEGAAEIDSAELAETVMFIPWKLVPRVRDLLRKKEAKPKRRQKSTKAA